MPKFSIKKVYEKLTGAYEPVYWEKLIWNRLSILKRKMISWMTMKRGCGQRVD